MNVEHSASCLFVAKINRIDLLVAKGFPSPLEDLTSVCQIDNKCCNTSNGEDVSHETMCIILADNNAVRVAFSFATEVAAQSGKGSLPFLPNPIFFLSFCTHLLRGYKNNREPTC